AVCYAKRDGNLQSTVIPPPRNRGRGPKNSANVVSEENKSHVFIVTNSASASITQHIQSAAPTDVASNSNHCAQMTLDSHATSATDWYVDSGASEHYCNDRNLFTTFTSTTGTLVTVGDGHNIAAEGTGDVKLKLMTVVNNQS